MIQKLGILGAGQMGAGIAQTAAQSGFQVILADQTLEFSEKGKSRIAGQLIKLIEKSKINDLDAQKTLQAITCVGGMKDLAQTDLVIEAVTEKPELKYQIF